MLSEETPYIIFHSACNRPIASARSMERATQMIEEGADGEAGLDDVCTLCGEYMGPENLKVCMKGQVNLDVEKGSI